MVETSDRRPIAARELGVFKSLSTRLAKAGVSANAISVAGMLAGLLAGAALVCTARRPELARIAWVAAAAFIQLRLLANMLDGMVAIESGTTSKVGELYNEIPDRVSDTAALVGLGYAAGGDPVFGWAAALAAMFTAYVRTTGKGAGAKHDFRGPMAKQQRMFLVTVTAVFLAIAPALYPRAPKVVLAIIVVGSVLTALRRLVAIAGALRTSA